MKFLGGFICGLLVGAPLGICILAMCKAASERDRFHD